MKPGHREKPETAVVRAGLAALRRLGWYAWRQNTGMHQADNPDGTKRFVRYGVVGQPDLTGWAPWGAHLACEAKAPGGRLSVDQHAHLELARRAGCAAIVYSTVDELLEQVALYEAVAGQRRTSTRTVEELTARAAAIWKRYEPTEADRLAYQRKQAARALARRQSRRKGNR